MHTPLVVWKKGLCYAGKNFLQVSPTYLKYVSIDDIYPYSIDEVFIDATQYLRKYKMNAHDFAAMLIRDVLKTYGVTATAGIAENMYLCKIALDITARSFYETVKN